jgi:hypothetical protein
LFSSFLGGKISAGNSVTTLDTEIEEIRTPLTKIEIDESVVMILDICKCLSYYSLDLSIGIGTVIANLLCDHT